MALKVKSSALVTVSFDVLGYCSHAVRESKVSSLLPFPLPLIFHDPGSPWHDTTQPQAQGDCFGSQRDKSAMWEHEENSMGSQLRAVSWC